MLTFVQIHLVKLKKKNAFYQPRVAFFILLDKSPALQNNSQTSRKGASLVVVKVKISDQEWIFFFFNTLFSSYLPQQFNRTDLRL